jgi:hypothetical protein
MQPQAVHHCDPRGQWRDDRVLLVPAPVATPPAPTVSGLACFSFDRRFGCDSTATGGVAPLEFRWTVNGTDVPAFDDQPSVTGRCTAGHAMDVQVSVRDAVGNRTQRSERVQCY